jgi:PAS domain S-box-containing protein
VYGTVEILMDALKDLGLQKAYFEHLFNDSPEAIAVFDRDDRFLDINKAFRTLFQYDTDEVRGKTVHELIVPQEFTPESTLISQKVLANEVVKTEGVRKRKDGSRMHVSILASPVMVGKDRIGVYKIYRDITEQKKTEATLRQLSLAVEQSPAYIIITDTAGTIQYVNPKFTQITGYTAEEAVGKNPRILSSGRMNPDTYKQLWTTITSGAVWRGEFYNKRKSGELYWEAAQISPITDADGVITNFLSVNEDITKRKRAEEALRQSELQFRLVWEKSAEGMRLINEQGVVLRVNEAFCRMVGKQREEIEGKPFTVIYTKAQQERILRRYQARFSSRSIGHHYEREFTLWNGKKVWFEASNSYFEVAGQAPLLLSILRNVTERKHAQESIQKLLNAVEQTDEVIFMTDSEGIITYVNPAFERVYGFTKNETLGRTPHFLESGTTTTTEQYESFWQDLLSGKRVQSELVNKSKDGRLISVDTSMNPIFDGQGDIIGFIAVQSDITERKRGEEERKTLQQQLFQAQKMESIGTLAGGIAHDFNNILGIILGHTSFIEPGDIDPATLSTRMGAITKAVQRGANLVRQILTFARKTDAALEPVNVNTTIEELAKMLRETFPKTTEIALHLDKTTPLIMMDHTQLHQALLNLCVNARDAMNDPSWTTPKGSTLSIKTEILAGDTLRMQFADAAGSQYICISVSDTGMGMDEATKQRIFEPFFTTKESGRGTGLGLAVVYGVVKSHQGFVDVESQLGRGTTFRLYLPIPESIIELPKMEEKQSAEIPGGTETLLLVEDEESLLDLMKILLENKGYRVLTAHNGMEAIQVYTQHKESIALVLTDIGLPKLGGKAVVATLAGINPRLDIIVASGFLAPHVKAELEQAGAKEFVHKPYMPAEIFMKIREVIDRACTP